MIWVAGGLALVVLVAALLPRYLELRRQPVTKRERQDTDGGFVGTSRGLTHYRILGPTRGPFVVCVHGLTTPSAVFEGLAVHLARMGFRVLVYDLYGRGLSARPHGRQTPEFFTLQLRELLDDLNLTEELTLVGYSMGGAIAAAFAAEEDHRLRRIVLLAPAGMATTLGREADWAAKMPGLGDWLFHMAFPRAQRAAIEAERGIPSEVEGIAEVQTGELTRRGYVRSVLSSLRYTLSEPMEAAHRSIAAGGLPVLAIWGREDAQIPLRAMSLLTEWNRIARQEVIDGAGHGLPYTHAAEVAALVARELEDERHR